MESPQSSVPTKGNVRNIISVFENQNVTIHNETSSLVRRTKSMVNLNYVPTKREPRNYVSVSSPKDLELRQIEQEVQNFSKIVHNYNGYSRDNHIYYQNQIFFILASLGSFETGDNPQVITVKSELIETLKKLNRKLNSLLPSAEKIEASNYETPKRDYNIFNKRKSSNVSIYKSQESLQNNADDNVELASPEPVLKNYLRKAKSEEYEEENEDLRHYTVQDLKKRFEQNSKLKIETVKIPTPKLGQADFNKYVPYNEKFGKSIEEEEEINEDEGQWTVTPASDDDDNDDEDNELENDDEEDSNSEKTLQNENEDDDD